MDAILYNKIENEANRIINVLSGDPSTPVAEATITNVVTDGGSRYFDVTLSKEISKGIILFEADATTEASIYSDTSSAYNILSMIAMYPATSLVNGSATFAKRIGVQTYRGSAGSFYARGGVDGSIDISLSGTTMTVTWVASALGTTYPNGTYKVTVWEIADS